jgi:hypothetical protein
MVDKFALPDFPHIELLRQRLWCRREFGQAAVMVGSGFSRNAIGVTSSTPRFPLLRELEDRFRVALYPSEPTRNIGVARLAGEYEIAFGRAALDRLLLEAIPDSTSLPGDLHRFLLELPWSDVFTTNYDSLLERARAAVHERKYDLVETAFDIPGKMKPRIVKLHGSFPAHRPFIITEEDYRSYPRKSASFVNMVQQAIMENVLCLIGFSADDPNFLCWTGWVRDNLGEAAPLVYLCGMLDLTAPQRKELENRGVVPIDLSPLLPANKEPDPDRRHARAIQWFLRALRAGAPPEPMRWPLFWDSASEPIADDLPPIPLRQSVRVEPSDGSPKSEELDPDTMKATAHSWQSQRLAYPGWVICPELNRERLWNYTEKWIEPILGSITKLDPPDDILLLHELNWRLETTLTPLYLNWVERMAPVVNKYNPWPGLVKMPEATVSPNLEAHAQLKWKPIADCWVALVFALAREAREDGDEDRFASWMARIERIVNQREDWLARWHYERCQLYLSRLSQAGVRSELANWPATKASPWWDAKRASVLAELGDFDDATRSAECALNDIRSCQQPYTDDYSFLSQEAWTMMPLRRIKLNDLAAFRALDARFSDRLNRLACEHCDPEREISSLSSAVREPCPFPTRVEVVKDFGPGQARVERHIWSGVAERDPGLTLLRLFDEAGLPARCGVSAMFSADFAAAARRIQRFAPAWSIVSAIRSSDEDSIKGLFSRADIAALGPDRVQALRRLFVDALTEAVADLEAGTGRTNHSGMTLSGRLAQHMPELLSRLCFRFSPTQLEELFDLAVRLYGSQPYRENHVLSGVLHPLFERLLYAMPDSLTLDRMTEILTLPIPTVDGFKVVLPEPETWCEPARYLSWVAEKPIEPNRDCAAWAAPIERLLGLVREGSPEARKRAVLRLMCLNSIQGLTSGQELAFGEAIFARVDQATHLPSETGLFRDFVLHFPKPVSPQAKEAFRTFFASAEFPRYVQRSKDAEGKNQKTYPPSASPHITEIIKGTLTVFRRERADAMDYVDWTPGETQQLLQRVANWWDDQKAELRDRVEFDLFNVGPKFRQQIAELVDLMSLVLLPRLGQSGPDEKTLAKRVLSEIRDADCPVESALPTLLFIEPGQQQSIARELVSGINSLDERRATRAAQGAFRWLVYGMRGDLPRPPADVLNELANKVLYRRQPALVFAIDQLAEVVRIVPDALEPDSVRGLVSTLGYFAEATALTAVGSNSETVAAGAIPQEDRPACREVAAKLAHRLHFLMSSKGAPIPQQLEEWRDICLRDPLPEVRRAWQ